MADNGTPEVPSVAEQDAAAAQQPDPAERLWQLWQQGERPDLDAFLAWAGELTAEQLAAVLRVDQRARWEAGEGIQAEAYLARYPIVQTQEDCALDLIYNEYLIRTRLGQSVEADEYTRRFPPFAATLRLQIELHRAMAGLVAGGPTSAGAVAMEATHIADQKTLGVDTLATAEQRTAVRGELAAEGIPAEFGRYRVERMLGRGGMGTVYLAYDTQLDRPVALKVPRFGDFIDQRLLERFYREARIAANFAHPHLCPVYDVGQIGGVHYLTMPFLRGDSLSAVLRRERPLDQRQAARWACQVARALAVAHAAGVVHRDLKPANVMLNEQGEPVVMDFGLARRDSPRDPRLSSAAIVGTPAYSPPEQIGGDSALLGPPSDVYSLGVMLYEMLTGRLPFSGTLQQIIKQVLVDEPAPPSRHRPDLDRALESICLKAMAKQPASRFQSMAAVAAALEGYLDGTSSPVTQEWGEQPPRRRRRRTVILAAMLALIAILAGGVWQWRIMFGNAADALPAGSRWNGTFKFLDGPGGDVQVDIEQRAGDTFKGAYRTERGAYEWRILGTLRNGAVRWTFTGAVRDNEDHSVVGQAFVEGRLQGNRMDVRFHQPRTAEQADMTLTRAR